MISFIDQLEDFSLPAHEQGGMKKEVPEKPQEKPVEKPPVVPVDTSIHIEPEELEELKKKIFDEGYQKGKEETHDLMLPQVTESVEDIFSFLEKEEKRRRDMMTQFVRKMTEVLCDVVGKHFSGENTTQEGLSQDLVLFVQDCIDDCEGKIVISCSEADENVLKKAFEKEARVVIESDPAYKAGSMKLNSSYNEITLDNSERLKKIHERIMSAVKSMTAYSAHEAKQENK